MTLNHTRALKYLNKFDFESLFIEELGWDTVDRVVLPLEVEGAAFELVAIAQKRGFVVYQCVTAEIPARLVRVKLDRQLTEYSKSHLLVFGDGAKQTQTWMWVRQEPGKPLAPKFQEYRVGQSGERLLQKLEALAVAFAEEEKLTLVDVAQRVKKAFDVEKVTKKFFTRFEKEHGDFLKFIDGIQSEFDRSWYASLMLNRLMFVYFIQKKGFLDDDCDYLQKRLKRCRAELGEGEFYSFYRQFLLKLFHEGLGKPGRDTALDKLLGKVPYLNGGLFEVHQLEEKYDAIQVPDEAFEKVFVFFDEFEWCLDDRPLSKQNEINPDVLGYIFEKYINQKQMGAYYTKEDITEYISKNTIIPFLFDAAQKSCKVAFKPDGAVWALLRESPDRYIYDAVRKGVDIELPESISVGIDDVVRRDGWNKPAAADVALPTETWREHVARRSRCLDLRSKLAAGDVLSINDLITYNLDIRQFAQDVITGCESSDLLKSLYRAIEQVSVLDPTCGSGAFLFAALNILEPLYTSCLERMQGFVDEDDLRLAGAVGAKPRYEKFRVTLAEMAKHQNLRYFVLKSIMLNNLYGVDIMEEATEICKLRLFLKLVAQMEPQPKLENFGLEPLPDIDFNIRAGNTLVGFASLDEVRKAIKADGEQLRLDFQDDAGRINEKAELANRAFQRFRGMQTEFGMNAEGFRDAKKDLRGRLAELNDELNRYLAEEYGVDLKKKDAFEEWRDSHQPFHWFVEFYSIIDRGGFDVIIGNPPYVEYSVIRKSYKISEFKTESCGNLYAFATEQSLNILNERSRLGLILPLSSFSTTRAVPLQELWRDNALNSWLSHYEVRPAKLFTGNNQRITIVIGVKGSGNADSSHLTTKYLRWYTEERDILFQSISYIDDESWSFKKLENFTAKSINKKMTGNSLAKNFDPKGNHCFYWHRIPLYFIKAIDFEPYFNSDRDGEKRSDDYKMFTLKTEEEKLCAMAMLNSGLMYWYWVTCFEGYHFGKHDVLAFPAKLEKLSLENAQALKGLACQLMQDYQLNLVRRIRDQKNTTVEYDEFRPKPSKLLMDEIDRVLAQHYGFTDEELDFIINYDIKYRMGRDKGGDE